MYNSVTRLQNVFGFFTTVAFVVAAIIAASDFAAPRAPTSTVRATHVQVSKGRPHYYSTKKEEYAAIKFSLEADLSSLFTWNTKQVFVYVTAEWASPSASSSSKSSSSGGNNTAVIWDTIITSPSADHLSNLGPIALKKLRRSVPEGKAVDPSRGLLSLKNQRPKYQITHPTGRIASAEDVVLRLHYNVQPWVGALTWNQDPGRDLGLWKGMAGGASESFALPAVKQPKEKSAGAKAKKAGGK